MRFRFFSKGLAVSAVLAGLWMLCGCSSVSHVEPTPVRVAVTESLRPAMMDIARAYEDRQPFVKINVIAGNALSLTRQMLAKVPADLTILDSTALMDELSAKEIIVDKSRATLLVNALVCMGREDSPFRNFDMVEKDAKATLAVGDLKGTVLGQYTQVCMDRLKLTETFKDRLLQVKSSDAVASAVLNGEASAGIGYQSTAAVSRGIRIISVFPLDAYGTIVYDAAVLRAAPHYAQAWEFLSFLRGEQASEIFRRHGLTTAGKPFGRGF